MRAKRPDTKYNGVFYDAANPAKPYRAWVKNNCKLVQLGFFENITAAILAADFARYILWGPDPRRWFSDGNNRICRPPNTVPVRNLPFDRVGIVAKLIASYGLNPVELANNLASYDEMAARVSEGR